MRPWLKKAVGGTLGLLGLAATHLPDSWAEIYYEGGFVYPTPAGGGAPGYAPRYDPPPPMRILFTPYASAYPATSSGSPGEASGSRFYSYRSYYSGVEPGSVPGDAPVGPAEKYSLEASALPQRVPAEYGSAVVLVAHLPEDAALWVEGALTSATGRTRYFVSPPLPPGKKYRYAVKAVWREGGRWVGQTIEVLVRAGEVHGIYLTAATSRRLPPTR